MSDSDTALRIAQECLAILDNPNEWSDGPWEHLGDATQDFMVVARALLSALAVGDRLYAEVEAHGLSHHFDTPGDCEAGAAMEAWRRVSPAAVSGSRRTTSWDPSSPAAEGKNAAG